jgi:hypothetical protein
LGVGAIAHLPVVRMAMKATIAFSSEVGAGSRKENASKQESKARF